MPRHMVPSPAFLFFLCIFISISISLYIYISLSVSLSFFLSAQSIHWQGGIRIGLHSSHPHLHLTCDDHDCILHDVEDREVHQRRVDKLVEGYGLQAATERPAWKPPCKPKRVLDMLEGTEIYEAKETED